MAKHGEMSLQAGPDDALVGKALAGDTAAFRVLVDRHRTRVVNLAYRMLGDRQGAEDVAQDVFLRAYRALGTYRPGGSFVRWLLAIASNRCIDELRRRPFVATTGQEAWETHARAALPQGEPAAAYQRREVQARVHGALGELPHAQRLAVVLVHLQGLSYEEAAEIMRRPVGTVKSHVHRARARLRKLLAPYVEEESP